MTKVYVDTDVLLDVFLERDPFKWDSAGVFSLADEGRIRISISALSLMNAHYTLQKNVGADEANRRVNLLLEMVDLLPVTEKHIRLALSGNHIDFEDSVQFMIAKEEGMDLILTRNIKDFRHSTIPVLTPSQFLATLP